MRVLVACEESQIVTKAFRARGHEAYSCDIIETSGEHPEWHFKQDVTTLLEQDWDLIIAHPPCTYLTVSNNNAMKYGCKKYTAEEGKRLRKEAIDFFMLFVNNKCPKIAIENPIGIMSTVYKKPKAPYGQIIQPWQFGHGETKATCLWLKGLPLLKPTNIVSGREQKVWKMPPSPERDKLRSKTYSGIAEAMASQWG
jgi:hypothetical protein